MASTTSQAEGGIRLKQPSGRWILLAAVLGSSMAMLDSTVVNGALPTIGKDLHTSLGGLQWTVTAYTLTLAGLILLGGSLGDRLGRPRGLPAGGGWVAVGCGSVRPGAGHWRPYRRPGAAGGRRRAADAGLAGDHPGHLRRGRQATGGGCLVRARRRRLRHRPGARRLARADGGLALGFPAESAARGGC